MINRVQEIKKKGFNMTSSDSTGYKPVDFSKIKVSSKKIDDAIYNLGSYSRVNPLFGDKEYVLKAINQSNYAEMRDISNFYYKTSGIYSRLCRYMAYLYRYDWMITPHINQNIKTQIKVEKITDEFNKILYFFDNFQVKKFLGEVALKVIRCGCYYGYIITKENSVYIQELPVEYCRSRFSVNGRPLIEFNMRYFDDYFTDTVFRMRILDTFPKEFKKGYNLYKEGKLQPDFNGDTSGWFCLEPGYAIKFNINGEDFPAFISVIPAIIDLNNAQELDRKKMAQQLLRIIIQKMPIDKNGDLVFDVDEAQQLHANAVQMLNNVLGVDVLTTFADVTVADMSDRNNTTTTDELEKVERTVYNEAGVSQMQFNTDGNLALEKSILNDEASMYNLIMQFEGFLNDLLKPYNKNPKKIYYSIQILPTTIYNYKDIAKLYKEQTQLGYSKMLPQIALGQSQSAVLSNAYFENDILDLVDVFIPPIMSSTMSLEMLQDRGEVGRKEKPDDEKAEKTIQNEESMS